MMMLRVFGSNPPAAATDELAAAAAEVAEDALELPVVEDVDEVEEAEVEVDDDDVDVVETELGFAALIADAAPCACEMKPSKAFVGIAPLWPYAPAAFSKANATGVRTCRYMAEGWRVGL